MGRRWKRNSKNKHTGAGKSRDSKPSDPSKYGQERDPWSLIEAGNFKMESFFAYQGLHDHYLDEATGTFLKCTTNEQKDEERKRWKAALKGSLPASFRIGSDVDVGLRERLEKELNEYVGKKMEITIQPKGGDRLNQGKDVKPEVKLIAPAKKIPYVPHAYQLSLDRQTIRRNTVLNPFHEWLKIQTEAGFITRQETVSMIPPVVLNPSPHHKVLDMCAAPGSKTSQLLEIVNLPANPKDLEPTGVVVANDNDNKRAYMLVHQMRRINSPAIFITNCDAQFFPLIPSKEHPTEGIFDRVLCDVPCSGDGTMRKNPGIWKRWNQLSAFGLHSLQLSIALKGARLTSVGGYLCYSTCSMNPMENESVVAELLRASEGCLELVDRRSELPGLLARPGMSTWKVLSEAKNRNPVKNHERKNNAKMQARRKEWAEKNKASENAEAEDEKMSDAPPEDKKETEDEEKKGDEVEEGKDTEDSKGSEEDAVERLPIQTPFEPTSYDEADLKKHVDASGLKEYKSFEDVPLNTRRRIRASVFPPTPEEAEKFHLDLCMRVMPQDMDTGGFFVSLLKKVAPMNARARKRFENLEKELNEKAEAAQQDAEPKVKKARIDPEDSAGVDTEGKTENESSENDKGSETVSEMKDATADETENDTPAVVEAGADELLKLEKDSTTVVRGHVKRHFLSLKDGSKHDTIGKDDFIPVPNDIFEPIRKFYGLSSETFDEGQYMVRACGDTKKLYFVPKTIKMLIEDGMQERLTVINSGLKGFIRGNKECEVSYRVAQEGVHFIAPHMTKRKIGVDIEDFQKCLATGAIAIAGFSEKFADQVRPLVLGSFVVFLNGYEDDYIKKLVLVMWRCRGDNLNVLVNQPEIDGMKSKIRSVSNKDDYTAEAKPKEAEVKPEEAKAEAS